MKERRWLSLLPIVVPTSRHNLPQGLKHGAPLALVSVYIEAMESHSAVATLESEVHINTCFRGFHAIVSAYYIGTGLFTCFPSSFQGSTIAVVVNSTEKPDYTVRVIYTHTHLQQRRDPIKPRQRPPGSTHVFVRRVREDETHFEFHTFLSGRLDGKTLQTIYLLHHLCSGNVIITCSLKLTGFTLSFSL